MIVPAREPEDQLVEGGFTKAEFLAILEEDADNDHHNNLQLRDHDVPKFFRDSHLHLMTCTEEVKVLLRNPRTEGELALAVVVTEYVSTIYNTMSTEHWR